MRPSSEERAGRLVRRFPRSQNFPYPRSKFLSCMIRPSAAGGAANLKLHWNLARPVHGWLQELWKPEARARGWSNAFWQLISQIPNPSLALQASMAQSVSFSNGASTAGGSTNLKLHWRTKRGSSPQVVQGVGCQPGDDRLTIFGADPFSWAEFIDASRHQNLQVKRDPVSIP